MSKNQGDILDVIERRKKLGLNSVFYPILNPNDIDFLMSEGLDVVGTGEGYYIFF
jgi:hypothetical protein